MMKQFRYVLILSLVSLLAIGISCSSDENSQQAVEQNDTNNQDNDQDQGNSDSSGDNTDDTNDDMGDDDDNDSGQTNMSVSQDMPEQVFFLEGIGVADVSNNSVRFSPHETNGAPANGRSFIINQLRVSPLTNFFGLVGQRLIGGPDSTVEGEDEIANYFLEADFDYTYLDFSLNEGDLTPNATIEVIEPLEVFFGSVSDDPFGQSHAKFDSLVLVIRALEEGVLGLTSDGAPITQITYESRIEAFPNNRDSAITYNNINTSILTPILEDGFEVGVVKPINIYFVGRSLSGQHELIQHYGL